MNRFVRYDLIKYVLNPFPKCDLFKSEINKLMCCGNNEKCPLDLPKRTKCLRNPCCAIGSGAVPWCETLEYKKY